MNSLVCRIYPLEMKRDLTINIEEIGSPCRAEFLMKDGEFHTTEDAVVIGLAKGRGAREALRNLKKEGPYLKSYNLHRVAAREVGDAVYL